MVFLGPVQLIVLGSASPAYLARSSSSWSGCESDLVRVIGSLAACKDAGGWRSGTSATSASRRQSSSAARSASWVGPGIADEKGAAAAAVAVADAEETAADGGVHVFTEEDRDVFQGIPDHSAAEPLKHPWTVPLRSVISRAGGSRVSEGFINPLDLAAIGPVLCAGAGMRWVRR
jgi:hypothetical protein